MEVKTSLKLNHYYLTSKKYLRQDSGFHIRWWNNWTEC